MKSYGIFGMLLMVVMAGCATSSSSGKIAVLETKDITQAHETIGPVSVSDQIAEDTEGMIQGLAGYYLSKDGRVAGQIPSETKAALDAKTGKYKDSLFEKLGEKAKSSGADAVIGAEYRYIPPYVNLSSKATVTAQGTMIKYKKSS